MESEDDGRTLRAFNDAPRTPQHFHDVQALCGVERLGLGSRRGSGAGQWRRRMRDWGRGQERIVQFKH